MNYFISVVLLSVLVASVKAQATCSGTLSSPNLITSDITVPNGASCTLTASVSGSVTVGTGSSLTTAGTVTIFGSVSATASAALNFGGSLTINGGVIVDGATSVTVAPPANVGGLMVMNLATVNIQGTTAMLTVMNATSVTVGLGVSTGGVSIASVGTTTFGGIANEFSVSGNGNVNFKGGVVIGGGLLRSPGAGGISLCNATVLGGISLTEVVGDLSAVAGPTCGVSTISGTIAAEKGSGDITVVGAELQGTDVIAVEQTGDFDLTNIALSDISISQLTGSVTIASCADSDTTLGAVTGPISINNFKTVGDFAINNAGASVSITNSEFGDEILNIESVAGAITFNNLNNFSFVITQNQAVSITDVTAASGELKGNAGPVVLTGNTFTETLVCSENTGLSGSGNTIAFGDGQCASGLA